ncbi:MAG: hypothetical protein QXT88_04535 [Desulfurococcaceae archaeon]
MEKLENKLPPFANGSIVGDYKPLLKYMDIARKTSTGLNRLIVREDLDFLSNLIRTNERLNLLELLDLLKNRVKNRIDCSLASIAFKEAYGVDLGDDVACLKMAEILAGWIIEIAKTLGIINIRESWRNS